MEINSLDRFVMAQEDMYLVALGEVKNGFKRSHWMWYIFPQIRGLGMSPMAHKYGIDGIEEARAYLAHPVLSKRLIEICYALLELERNNPIAIFGEIDAMKLRSSMTLFAIVSGEDSVYYKVLERYYDGKMDERTLSLVGI